MSNITDQLGWLFSSGGSVSQVELLKARVADQEKTIGDQLRSINSLIESNQALREQIRKLETDCRMALNAMQHALGEDESYPTEGQDNEQRPDGSE